MIHRLENAGLGFFVKATESHQKIGMLIFFCNNKCACIIVPIKTELEQNLFLRVQPTNQVGKN